LIQPWPHECRRHAKATTPQNQPLPCCWFTPTLRANKLIREHYTMQGKSPEEATKYLISIGRNPNDQDFAPKLIELNPAKQIAIPGDQQGGN
jgi:hypothetical protein